MVVGIRREAEGLVSFAVARWAVRFKLTVRVERGTG
jgi:hypothetical protein